MSNQSKFDERLEYLRVISCFLVIFGHIANWYMRAYPNLPMHSYIGGVILNSICRVSVPLFFMISGALLLEQATDYKKNIKRTLNMLSKTVIWTVVYVVWDFLYLGDDYALKEMFAEPVRVHFWFMFVMVGIYATVPFWQKLVSGDSKALLKYLSIGFIVCSAIAFIAKYLKMSVTYEIPLIGGAPYVCYFIMGYAIRHYIDEIKIKRWVSIVAVAAGMAVTGILTVVFTLKRGIHYEAFSGFTSIFIVIPSLSVFYLFMKMNELKHFKWMSVISRYSFGIYMTHVFFLDILQENVDITKIASWYGAPLFFVIMLFASLGFTWLYEKVKGKTNAI